MGLSINRIKKAILRHPTLNEIRSVGIPTFIQRKVTDATRRERKPSTIREILAASLPRNLYDALPLRGYKTACLLPDGIMLLMYIIFKFHKNVRIVFYCVRLRTRLWRRRSRPLHTYIYRRHIFAVLCVVKLLANLISPPGINLRTSEESQKHEKIKLSKRSNKTSIPAREQPI